MKKLIYSLFVIASIAVAVYATDDTSTISTATITSLKQSPLHLQSVEVINNAAAAVTAYFYDAPTNVLTWVSGAYTNWTTVVSNLVVTTTNYQGVVETATNYVTQTTGNAHGAATNNYRLFKTMTVAAGASATWTPVNGTYLSYGLAVTNNNTNTVINYSYSLTK